MDAMRLQSTSGISDRGLAELLSELHSASDGRAPKVSRHALRRQSQGRVEGLLRTVQVQMRTGPGNSLHIADPIKVLQHFVDQVPAFAAMAERTVLAYPQNHIFGLILYFDEITPGNAVKPQN